MSNTGIKILNLDGLARFYASTLPGWVLLVNLEFYSDATVTNKILAVLGKEESRKVSPKEVLFVTYPDQYEAMQAKEKLMNDLQVEAHVIMGQIKE